MRKLAGVKNTIDRTAAVLKSPIKRPLPLPFTPCGSGPPHSRGLQITQNDEIESVGLLWTSDRPDAENSTSQHTTFTTDKHPCPQWNSNPHSQQASGRKPTSQTARLLRPAFYAYAKNKSGIDRNLYVLGYMQRNVNTTRLVTQVQRKNEERSPSNCHRGIRVSIILSECVQSQLFGMQSACAELYCHLWPVRVYNIFPLYVIKGIILRGNNLLDTEMCVQIFCTKYVGTPRILRRIQRGIITNVHMISLLVKNRYYCEIFIKSELPRKIFEKIVKCQIS